MLVSLKNSLIKFKRSKIANISIEYGLMALAVAVFGYVLVTGDDSMTNSTKKAYSQIASNVSKTNPKPPAIGKYL